MFFVIGCIVEIILIVLTIFIPTLYTKDWWSYRIKNVASVSTVGDIHNFTMLNSFSWGYCISAVLVTGICVMCIILFLTKRDKGIPLFCLAILFAVPVVLMSYAKGQLKSEAYAIGDKTASIAAGSSSGYTAFGVLVFILFIANGIFVLSALAYYRKSDIHHPKTVEVVKIKKRDGAEDVKNIDEWKL